MNYLKGKLLRRLDGSVQRAEQVLKDTDLIGFYFSAGWCPACRAFTPILARFYHQIRKQKANMEIVFISSDHNESEMIRHMATSHGNWLCLPYGDPLGMNLKKQFGVRGIPTLIVVDRSGKVISSEGRNEVVNYGYGIVPQWTQKMKLFS